MPLDPKEWLDYAEYVDAYPAMPPGLNPEAVYRTLLGRAYYAVIISAQERLRRRFPERMSMPGIHAFIPRVLMGSRRNGLRKLAELLRAMELERTDADYRPDVAISHDQVLAQFQRARRALRLVDSDLQPASVDTIPIR